MITRRKYDANHAAQRGIGKRTHPLGRDWSPQHRFRSGSLVTVPVLIRQIHQPKAITAA